MGHAIKCFWKIGMRAEAQKSKKTGPLEKKENAVKLSWNVFSLGATLSELIVGEFTGKYKAEATGRPPWRSSAVPTTEGLSLILPLVVSELLRWQIGCIFLLQVETWTVLNWTIYCFSNALHCIALFIELPRYLTLFLFIHFFLSLPEYASFFFRWRWIIYLNACSS